MLRQVFERLTANGVFATPFYDVLMAQAYAGYIGERGGSPAPPTSPRLRIRANGRILAGRPSEAA
jgi:hypothetical protein